MKFSIRTADPENWDPFASRQLFAIGLGYLPRMAFFCFFCRFADKRLEANVTEQVCPFQDGSTKEAQVRQVLVKIPAVEHLFHW